MKSEFPSVPDLMIPFTDVRDVSKAHVAAMTKGVSGDFCNKDSKREIHVFY